MTDDKKAPALTAETLRKLNLIIAETDGKEKEELENLFLPMVRDFIEARGVI